MLLFWVKFHTVMMISKTDESDCAIGRMIVIHEGVDDCGIHQTEKRRVAMSHAKLYFKALPLNTVLRQNFRWKQL